MKPTQDFEMKLLSIFSAIFLALIIPSKIHGQALDLNLGGPSVENYFEEIQYEFIKGKIILSVEIGGKSRKFLLDTGAPTAISRNLFEELSPSIITKIPVTDIGGKSDSLLFVTLEQIALGQTAYTDIPAIVLNENLLLDCFEIEGFIGSNLLRNSIVQFDSKNKILRIGSDIDSFSEGLSNQAAIELDRQSSPILTIQIGKNIKESLIFDSGADEFYTMSERNFKQFRKAKGFEVIAESFGSDTFGLFGQADEEKSKRLLIPDFFVNGVTIHKVWTDTKNEDNSRIGSGLLRYGLFTLDYKNKNSYFELFEKDQNFEDSFWDVSPTFKDNKLVIGYIWSKELEKKIDLGDQIIKIDEMDTENIDVCDILLNSPMETSQKVTLTVRTKKGETIMIEILNSVNQSL